MEEFSEKMVFYGDLILSNEIISDLRCELTVNHTNTENNIAVISFPHSINFQIMNKLHLYNKFIFKSENHSEQIYIESNTYKFHSKFTWESSLVLYPSKVILSNYYSKKEINKVIFRAFITPSETLFNESVITFHEGRGLLSGWHDSKTASKFSWSDDHFKYQSQLGTIELVPAFLFQELKNDLYRKEYYALRQMLVYCQIDDPINIDELFELFASELAKFMDALSFLFVKRFSSWYKEIRTMDTENYPSFEKRIYTKSFKKVQLKDNRFIYGDLYKQWRPLISKIIDSLTNLNQNDTTLFNKLLDRYLVAFTYDKIDTKIIYALSCLDLIRNSFKKNAQHLQSFTPHLLDVCETNNIEWLDLFPYLTKSEVFDKQIKKDMYLNIVRNEIIHHGIYPSNYDESRDEILKARALSERFILKLLGIDYHSTDLGTLSHY